MTNITTTEPATKRQRKMAREPKNEDALGAAPANVATAPNVTTAATPPPSAASATRAPGKSSLVLEMLGRLQGATIDQLVTATGWLPHTTRAALTGLKKKGHVITSEKPADGARVYRVAAVTGTDGAVPASQPSAGDAA